TGYGTLTIDDTNNPGFSSKGYIAFCIPGPTKAYYISKITVVYETGSSSGASDYDPAYTTSDKLVKNADGTYSLTLAEEEEFTLEPTTADGPTISYSSDNEDVAAVDNTGTILAVGQGTATITGSWSEVTDTWNAGSVTINVTVTAADTRSEVLMEWSAAEASATLGGAFDPPTLTIAPNEALSEVVYSSSDTSVAEIAANGTITVKAAGTTTITAAIPDDHATYKPVSVSYTLTVTDPSSLNYTIVFKSGTNNDGTTNANESTILANGIESGADYLEAISPMNSVAYNSTYGLKFGGSSNQGYFTPTFTAKGKVKATKIVVNMRTYGTDASTVTINGGSAITLTGDLQDYEYVFDTPTEISSFKITATKASKCRFYVKAITVYYQETEKEDVTIAWSNGSTDPYEMALVGDDENVPTLELTNENALSHIIFTSSNTAVATVSETGVITRVGEGETLIKAEIPADDAAYNATSDEFTLKVTDIRDEVAITFTPESASSLFRQADRFEWPAVTAKVSDVEDVDARANLLFRSSNDEVIHVNETYDIHEIMGVGEADIIAYIEADNAFYKPVEAKCHVTIERETVTMTFTPDEVSASVFTDVTEPTLTIEPEEIEILEAITYSSSDESVATVDAGTGEVTINKAGTAVITATFDNESVSFNFKKATASYTITAADTRPTPTITWSCGAEMTYAMGSGEAFVSPTYAVAEAEGIVVDDVKALLTFASSDEAVATVSAEGVVEAKGEGTAVITATLAAGNATYAPTEASFTLTVSNSNPDVYYLTANGETFADGDYIIIAAADKTNFVSKEYLSGNDRKVYTLSAAAGSTITPTDADKFMIFKVVAAEGGVRLLTTNYGGTDGYATCASGQNYFQIGNTADNYSLFNITYENGNDAVIKNVGNLRWLRFNASKFRFYGSNTGNPVYIYKKVLAKAPDTPTFSQPDGTQLTWQTAAVTVTSLHATEVCYRTQYYDADAAEWQWSDWTSVEGNYAVIYVHDPCNIEAYGKNQYGESDHATSSYTIYGAGATIYNYVNSLDQVDLSKKYILVNRDNNVAMGSYNKSGKYHNIVEIGVSTDGASVTAQSALAFTFVKVTASDSDPFGGGVTGDTDPTEPAAIIARESASDTNTYNMLLDNGNYMKLSTTANETSEVTSATDATAFKVTFTDGLYVLLTDTASGRYLGCNYGSNRFSSYSDNSYKSTYLFQEGEQLVTGVESVAIDDTDSEADVEWYTLQGVRVENPGSGFYIRRCGNKATKHLLK
ncbi:MAG: Ig-like domain-containing protein, partial [Muribaculaceae bacterium]